MKHSNPAMMKPSLGRVNGELTRWKPNMKSKKVYEFVCPNCGNTFTFMEKDLADKVLTCDKCHYEEIFFACNYM